MAGKTATKSTTVDSAGGEASRQSLEERAYREIQRMLVRLEITPAGAVDEVELGERLGLGRTPVRRALKRLALEGLVTIYPRRGTFATDISIDSLSKLTDLRVAVEGLAAELAARSESSRSRLSAMREQIVVEADAAAAVDHQNLTDHPDAADQEGIFDVYKQVHAEIYRLADNEYLTNVAWTHYQLSYRLWYAFDRKLQPLRSHRDFYLELIDAIDRHDAQRARELAEQHVLDFREEVRSTL